MNRLFTTLGRSAIVALGLAVAPAAFAQPASCAGGTTPVWTGEGTSSASFTCQLSCTGNQVVSIVNNVASCTGGGGGPVAPAGCTLSRSPASGGPGATTVQLTLSCSSGTLPINVAWSGGAPGNCPTTMNSLSVNCQVPSVAATTTWTVSQFSNEAGNGSNNANKSATFTYNAGGGGLQPNFSNCPQGSAQYALGANGLNFQGAGALWLSGGQYASMAIVVPASTGTYPAGYQGGKKTSQWSYYGQGGGWTWSISETACDVTAANAVQAITSAGAVNPFAKAQGYTSSGIQAIYYKVGANLSPNKVYYLNIKADSSGAGIIGGVPTP